MWKWHSTCFIIVNNYVLCFNFVKHNTMSIVSVVIPLGTATIEVNSVGKRCNNAGCIGQSLGIIGSKLHYQRAITWKGKTKAYPCKWLHNSNHNYRTFKHCNSRWLVVNSLSLALVDWMKSDATIIGVKHTSQLYFLTKDLNASLWDYIIL